VSKRFLSMADQSDWLSPEGVPIAIVRKRMFTWGPSST
jgi:hypothetical protein